MNSKWCRNQDASYHFPKELQVPRFFGQRFTQKNVALQKWAPELLPSQAACRPQRSQQLPYRLQYLHLHNHFHKKKNRSKVRNTYQRNKNVVRFTSHYHLFMDQILYHLTWQSSYPPTLWGLAAEARCPAPKTDTKTCLEAENWGTAVGKYLFLIVSRDWEESSSKLVREVLEKIDKK